MTGPIPRHRIAPPRRFNNQIDIVGQIRQRQYEEGTKQALADLEAFHRELLYDFFTLGYNAAWAREEFPTEEEFTDLVKEYAEEKRKEAEADGE